MRPLATAFAPGKLILSGEHAVVYGQPALAFAVNRGCRVNLHRRSGASGVERAPVDDPRLDQALAKLLPAEGLGVEITSDLPIGRGMGSSAAMSIALIEALAQVDDEALTFEEIHARGFVLERVFHGTPSGIDHAVSALGGMLHYQQTTGHPQMEQLNVHLPDLVVLDSGAPGNTAEQIAKVRALGREGTRVCEEIGELTRQVIELLPSQAHAKLGGLMTRNHQLLTRLGVSTPTLDALVELSLEAGAYGAKLAGAGGGGVVIAAVNNPASLLDAAARAGYTAFSTQVHPIRRELS